MRVVQRTDVRAIRGCDNDVVVGRWAVFVAWLVRLRAGLRVSEAKRVRAYNHTVPQVEREAHYGGKRKTAENQRTANQPN